DDQEVRAGASGLGRRGGPDLVCRVVAGRTDPGGDDAERGPVPAFDGLDLDGGCDDAVEPGVGGEGREPGDLFAQGAELPAPDLFEVGGGEGGQHGDADDQRPIDARRLAGGPEHSGAAGGVDGEHVHAEGSGGFDGARHGRRDVMVLQIEEDALSAALERAHDVGPCGGEELGADLVPVHGRPQALHEVERGPGIGQIEGDDNGRHRFVVGERGGRRGHGIRPAPMSSRMSVTPVRRPYRPSWNNTRPGVRGSEKRAVPTCTRFAPASRYCRASAPERMPPAPMMGTSTRWRARQTAWTPMGRMAGPLTPPDPAPTTGRRVSRSKSRPGNVLINVNASAPASTATSAMRPMSGTL